MKKIRFKVVEAASGVWRIKDVSNHGKYLPTGFVFWRRAVNVARGVNAGNALALRAANRPEWDYDHEKD